MKAAIVTQVGSTPVYGDFAEPVKFGGEINVKVTAAALSQLVRSRASGKHYSSSGILPFIVGVDGVGRLDDGRRVYFAMPNAPYGSMAERVSIRPERCVFLPDNIDDITAAAIANPGMSSWAALKERAKLVAGETVLVNGATGTSGKLAVQIAKHMGARKVIATGRDLSALQSLTKLGADVTIPLTQDAQALEDVFTEQFRNGVDVVVDYLWGVSAERLLIGAAKGSKNGKLIRFVQVGSVSGQDITLPSAVLRSIPLQLMGSGIGSVPLDRLLKSIDNLFAATVSGGFEIATEAVPLADVEKTWAANGPARTVYQISVP